MDNETFPVYKLLTFPCHACHRGGGSTFGPENTMYVYRKSVWECNTQILEIDLQLTADNELVLLHDSTVDRTTNRTGPCRSFTLEELRKLDAAWNYVELRGQGIQIPTFQEFLDEFLSKENLVFFLDFKDAAAAEKTLNVVKERGFDRRIILGSIVPAANEFLAAHKPSHVPLVSDAITTIKYLPWVSAGIQCDWKHDIFGFFMTPSTAVFFGENLVQQVHKQGKRVVVAGVSLCDKQVLSQLIAWKVDIIMTDRPDLLAEILASNVKN